MDAATVFSIYCRNAIEVGDDACNDAATFDEPESIGRRAKLGVRIASIFNLQIYTKNDASSLHVVEIHDSIVILGEVRWAKFGDR